MVREVDGLRNSEDFTKLDGEIDYRECQILLDVACKPQTMRVVLWHEVIHAILSHAGISEQSERLVDAIAYGVVQTIRDNPRLVRAFASETERKALEMVLVMDRENGKGE
jgi:predicted metal-dependent peptidase